MHVKFKRGDVTVCLHLWQTKLSELEERYAVQQERHDQCTLQIEQLRIEAEKARHRPETNTSHAQTEVLLPQAQSETAAKMGNDNLLRRLQGNVRHPV